MEPLQTARVHGKLEGGFKLLGFEAQDLILLLLLASVMNLLFGATNLGALMTFGPSSLLGGVLFFCKRDKPEGYLVHLIRFYTSPGFFSAGTEGRRERRGKIYG